MSTATKKAASGDASAGSSLPRWVNTVLVVLIGYALAVFSLKLLPAAQMPLLLSVSDQATSSGSPTSGNQPSIDKAAIASRIASRHHFGDAAVVVEAPKETVKAKPKDTKLNLTLVGVFAYDPQSRAIAIISTGRGEEAAYGVGDTILGQVTLKEVYTDRVILDNRGRDEVLKLPENSTPIATRSAQPIRQASNNNANSNAGQQAPMDLPTTPGALRDTLARNPSMLGRIVAAEPYQENGKLRGYRITPKQNPEILEAQGILAGDIITRVNNIELNSQKQGIRALRNAVKAQNLEVTILRDGVEIPVSISLAE